MLKICHMFLSSVVHFFSFMCNRHVLSYTAEGSEWRVYGLGGVRKGGLTPLCREPPDSGLVFKAHRLLRLISI